MTMPKRDLVFRKPLMNAAGTLGFTPDTRMPIDWDELGAFITNPVSRRPRSAAEHPGLVEYPGGFLVHTGLPNPGFSTLMQSHARRWEESSLPIIVHLMADRPEETRDMVRRLESTDNILALELGFAPLLSDDIILLAVEMSRGEIPLIVCLPRGQILRLGPKAMHEGASAISIAAPRGSLMQNGQLIDGRLFGRSLLPVTLDVVHSAAKIGLPIIGAGGVYSAQDLESMLVAGALAVQVDAQLWLPQG